jgi:hypothetical protein
MKFRTFSSSTLEPRKRTSERHIRKFVSVGLVEALRYNGRRPDPGRRCPR